MERLKRGKRRREEGPAAEPPGTGPERGKGGGGGGGGGGAGGGGGGGRGRGGGGGGPADRPPETGPRGDIRGGLFWR